MNMVREELFGKDEKIKKTLEMAKELADKNIPILIQGEVGTGKQSLAVFIHQNSIRKTSSSLVVDCTKGEKSVEDEILGHRDEESGKYNKGILEKANGGTIILKNVDGLCEDFQKKLHKIFHELNDYDINIRIISTTTKNISKLVGAGRFSRALYLYISGQQLFLQPLRERKEDIRFLAQTFLEYFAQENFMEPPMLTSEAYEKVMNYYWSTNLIEFKSVLYNSLRSGVGGIIGLNELCLGEKKLLQSFSDDEDGIKLMSLKEAEKLLIKKALIHTSENRTQAAKILGVSIRTLRNKINEYRNDGTNYFVNLR